MGLAILKFRQLLRAKAALIAAGLDLLLILDVAYNSYVGGFDELASLLNVTFINAGILVPACLFICCSLYNSGGSYKLRFASKGRWLRNESGVIAAALLIYTAHYVAVAAAAQAIYSSIAYGGIYFDRTILLGLIMYALALYVWALIHYALMLCINGLFGLRLSRCGYIVFCLNATVYTVESLLSLNGAIIPMCYVDLSLTEHIIAVMPNAMLLLLVGFAANLLQKSGKKNA